jgi:Recombinase
VGEEELLERGFSALQLTNGERGQYFQQGLHRSLDLAAQPLTVHLDPTHSGYTGQVGHRSYEGRLDGRRRQVSHLRQRAEIDENPGPQDGNPVAQGLHLAEDVRRLFLMLAQWQRDTLAESWDATRERHIANGVANNEPYGYVRDENRQLVPDPDEADFVREMFDLRIQGKDWVAIAKAINEAGAKPRRAEKFTYARISGIVANRVYLGELRSGEFVNVGAHEAIVSKAIFDAANQTRSLRTATEVQTSLLAAIVRCASCGQKMRSESRSKHRYYRCRVRHG